MTTEWTSGRLRDATESGIFVASADERQLIEVAALAADMLVVPVDLAATHGKADVLTAVARAFRFPDWFGNNWDALDDCLSDLSWLGSKGYVVMLDHCGSLLRSDRESLTTLTNILVDCVRSWRARSVAMWVFADAELPFRGTHGSH